MTKQAFDQIAEGLREAANTPPEWALTRALADILYGDRAALNQPQEDKQ